MTTYSQSTITGIELLDYVFVYGTITVDLQSRVIKFVKPEILADSRETIIKLL